MDFIDKLNKELEGLDVSYVYDKDYVDELWNDRPELSSEKVWKFDFKYTVATY